MSGCTYFLAFLCPEISKIKKKFSLRNLANYLLNTTHFFKILKLKDPKSVFWNILFIIEKTQKFTPKNQNFENPSTTLKFYVDLGPKKRVQEILSLEVYVMGGGSKLKVHGTDSYPVNECMYIYHYEIWILLSCFFHLLKSIFTT